MYILCDLTFACNMCIRCILVGVSSFLLGVHCFEFHGVIICALHGCSSVDRHLYSCQTFAIMWCFYKRISWGQSGRVSIRYVTNRQISKDTQRSQSIQLSEVAIRANTLPVVGEVSVSASLKGFPCLVMVKAFLTVVPILICLMTLRLSVLLCIY